VRILVGGYDLISDIDHHMQASAMREKAIQFKKKQILCRIRKTLEIQTGETLNDSIANQQRSEHTDLLE
jgi:hypothetical protein